MFAHAKEQIIALKRAIATIIVGQEGAVDQVLLGIFAGGHVLLEGAPGLGKTLLVRTLAETLDTQFSRIQFTPDLLPSDVIGTQVLVMDPHERAKGAFTLQKGPIFGQLVLADEINRATPKTQSALLEAMAEQSVTIAGQRHALDDPFVVLATENPIEMEGTYPLPEAQLDRFLLKVIIPSPTEDELCRVLGETTGQARTAAPRVMSRAELVGLRKLCRDVRIAEPVIRYAAKLARATDPALPEASADVKRSLRFGAGVRGAQSLVLASKARALMEGRESVSFDDIAAVALPVLRHRIRVSYEGEAAGLTADDVLRTVLAAVKTRPAEIDAEQRR
jgi:MoxR-like ATPase